MSRLPTTAAAIGFRAIVVASRRIVEVSVCAKSGVIEPRAHRLTTRSLRRAERPELRTEPGGRTSVEGVPTRERRRHLALCRLHRRYELRGRLYVRFLQCPVQLAELTDGSGQGRCFARATCSPCHSESTATALERGGRTVD